MYLGVGLFVTEVLVHLMQSITELMQPIRILDPRPFTPSMCCNNAPRIASTYGHTTHKAPYRIVLLSSFTPSSDKLDTWLTLHSRTPRRDYRDPFISGHSICPFSAWHLSPHIIQTSGRVWSKWLVESLGRKLVERLQCLSDRSSSLFQVFLLCCFSC
jgi:hypothetical protein